MAVLTDAKRENLKAKQFGLPKQRKYPMEDRKHAADAKTRASEMFHKGRISHQQEEQIDRKANKKLYG